MLEVRYGLYDYYMTTKQTAEKWQITDRRVLQYCNEGRIKEAEKMGHSWLIPKTAEKPADNRFKKRI